MIEIKGNLWDFYGQPSHKICITTNGTVKKDGAAVMGAGCAKEACQRIQQLEYYVGSHIQQNGNVIGEFGDILSFPVKHNWWEKADLALIGASATELRHIAESCYMNIYILPRPGCGNGKLSYGQVRPLLVNLPDNVLVIDFA